MSSGMIVQCSVQEGLVRTPMESLCRALWGNQIVSNPTYHYDGLGWSPFDEGATEDDTAYFAGRPYPTPYAQYVASLNAWSFIDTSSYAAKLALLNSHGTTYDTAPFGDGLNGASPNPADNANGWNFISSAAFQVLLGFAKNTTGVDQPYFIARLQNGQFGGAVPQGVTVTQNILTLVTTGIIHPNQVIASNGDINLPFPTSSPFEYANIGNAMRTCDRYFAVIGQDPSVWIATPLTGFPASGGQRGGNIYGAWGTYQIVTPNSGWG